MTDLRRHPWRPAVAALCVACLAGAFALAGCSKQEDPAPPAESPNFGPAPPPSGAPAGGVGGPGSGAAVPASAEQIFAQNCMNCHGKSGEGIKGLGESLGHADEHPDSELRQTILNGKGKMPAWKGKLTDEQVTLMVAYAKKLGAALPHEEHAP